MCGYDYGYVRIYLCMSLWEFFYLGHVKFFLWQWLMEKICNSTWICEKFDCSKILVGH